MLSCRCSTRQCRAPSGTAAPRSVCSRSAWASAWITIRASSRVQQQRVAIARALVNDPVLILADEPTGALDSRTSLEVMALLQQLNREGITVVLVTHEHDIADFAGRIVMFRDGRVLSDQPNPARDAAAALAALPAQQAA